MSDDWRVDSHDKEIKELRDKLREAKTEVWNDIRGVKEELRKELGEAKDRIRALENRPYEWFVRVMPVIIGIMAGAYVALLIAGVIHKH
jgi:hypothetical protein